MFCTCDCFKIQKKKMKIKKKVHRIADDEHDMDSGPIRGEGSAGGASVRESSLHSIKSNRTPLAKEAQNTNDNHTTKGYQNL